MAQSLQHIGNAFNLRQLSFKTLAHLLIDPLAKAFRQVTANVMGDSFPDFGHRISGIAIRILLRRQMQAKLCNRFYADF